MSKRLWLMTLLAVGLVGCSDNDSDSSDKCTSNAECTDAAKPVCNTATGVCEAKSDPSDPKCKSNADCKDAAKPVCNTSTGACEANADDKCKSNADCKDAAKPVCNTSTGACEANADDKCKSNADCKDASKPVCNTSTGACEANADDKCKSNADCKDASKPVCNTSTGACEANADGKCKSNADCQDASKPVCNTSTGACEAESGPVVTKCTSNDSCSGDTPVCDSASGSCVAGKCGDGFVTGSEECDTAAAMTAACDDFDTSKDWEAGGKPECGRSCQLAQGTCKEVVPEKCGNGTVDAGEECDPKAAMNKKCGDYDPNVSSWVNDGVPSCSPGCKLEAGSCQENLCDNGRLDEGEVCDFGGAKSKDCKEYSAIYDSGSAICNACTKIDLSKCKKKTDDIHWCQLMPPVKVALNMEHSSETLKMFVTETGVTDKTTGNDGGLDVELIYADLTKSADGTGKITSDAWNKVSWKSVNAIPNPDVVDDIMDGYKVDLKIAGIDSAITEGYYTFRYRKAGSSDAWHICTANNDGLEETINGSLKSLTVDDAGITLAKIDHYLGKFTVSRVINSVIALFDFSSGLSTDKINIPYKAETGEGTIQAFNTQCNAASSGGCFTNGADKAWNIKNWKKAKADAIKDDAAHILITVSTAGKTGIDLNLDVARSKTTSANRMVILYSEDKVTYTEGADIDIVGTNETGKFNSHSYSFPSAADNKANLYIKLAPYGDDNSLLRFDNVKITSGNK